MKSIRIGGFVVLGFAALGAFFGLASTSGVFSRVPTLVLIGVLALIWHFLTLRVFNRETMEIITEEIITEIDLPRPDGLVLPTPPVERFQIPHGGRPDRALAGPEDPPRPRAEPEDQPRSSAERDDDVDLRDVDSWILWARDLFDRPDPR